LAAAQQTWKVNSAPQALTTGSSWQLEDDHGDRRTIRIDKVDGDRVGATLTDAYQLGTELLIDATRSDNGWSIDRIRFAPVRDSEKHFVTLQFATPLSDTTERTELTLLAGKKKTIASGTAEGSGTASHHTLSVNFNNPAWLNNKTLLEESSSDGKSLLLTARAK
jgi:hypothetical protein